MAGIAAVYVSATSFTITGVDRTADFVPGRRVKANCGTDGYKICTVTSSTFSTNTTVNVTGDALTSNLTEAWFGIVAPYVEGGSQPETYHIKSLGNQSGAVLINGLNGDVQYMTVTGEITGWTFTNLALAPVLLHINNTGDATIAGVDDFADYHQGDIPTSAGIFTMYVYQIGSDVFAVVSDVFEAVV